MTNSEIMTLPEVSERTRIPINSLRYYRSRGEGLRTFKLGRKVCALRSDVEAWIADAYAADGRTA